MLRSALLVADYSLVYARVKCQICVNSKFSPRDDSSFPGQKTQGSVKWNAHSAEA